MALDRILLLFRRYIAYPAIIVVISGLCLSEWYPPLSGLISDSQAIILLALLLVLVYSSLTTKLDRLGKFIPQSEAVDFGTAFDRAIEGVSHIATLDFIGSTGGLFHPTFWSRRKYVKRMRVLIRDPSSILDSSNFPADAPSRDALRQRIDERYVDWQILINEGIVEQLEVRTFDFTPSFFAVLINRNKGFWGLFRQSNRNPFFHVMSSFVLDPTSQSSADMIRDFQLWFDVVFELSKIVKVD